MPTVLTGKHRALDRPGARVATCVPERQPQVDLERKLHAAGPWSDHLEGPVWELRIRLRDVAARITYWVYRRWEDRAADCVPED
jgi:hypothetical protein